METMKKMITITKDLNKRLKVYAALEEISVQDLMIMILDKFLQERGY
jgi:fructose-1,6-bisphosphatase/sedoheptulose 1,7-bisphosphatase-like protein